MSVDIDGNHAGDTKQKTFILKTVKPGKHVVATHTENTSELTLNTEAGNNYFIWLEVRLGIFVPRAELHLVDKEKGQAGVLESDLVK